jgi:hypothetical protein
VQQCKSHMRVLRGRYFVAFPCFLLFRYASAYHGCVGVFPQIADITALVADSILAAEAYRAEVLFPPLSDAELALGVLTSTDAGLVEASPVSLPLPKVEPDAHSATDDDEVMIPNMLRAWEATQANIRAQLERACDAKCPCAFICGQVVEDMEVKTEEDEEAASLLLSSDM